MLTFIQPSSMLHNIMIGQACRNVDRRAVNLSWKCLLSARCKLGFIYAFFRRCHVMTGTLDWQSIVAGQGKAPENPLHDDYKGTSCLLNTTLFDPAWGGQPAFCYLLCNKLIIFCLETGLEKIRFFFTIIRFSSYFS